MDDRSLRLRRGCGGNEANPDRVLVSRLDTIRGNEAKLRMGLLDVHLRHGALRGWTRLAGRALYHLPSQCYAMRTRVSGSVS